MRIARSHGSILAALTVLLLGCADDNNSGESKADARTDAGARDAETDVEQDTEACTQVPAHSDIINAATDAEKVDKQPVLPLLKSDGTLPPLP